MLLVLTDEQKVQLSIQPVTAAGNPAKLDGVPAWSVSDANVLSLEVAADGLSAWATAVGNVGTSQVSVSADADLGEGVREITAVLDVEVKAAEAVALTIAAGAPVLKT